MTENEIALIQLIRESEDPAKALQIAIQIAIDFLANNTVKGTKA